MKKNKDILFITLHCSSNYLENPKDHIRIFQQQVESTDLDEFKSFDTVSMSCPVANFAQVHLLVAELLCNPSFMSIQRTERGRTSLKIQKLK